MRNRLQHFSLAVILGFAILGAGAGAQGPNPLPEGWEVRTLEIKYNIPAALSVLKGYDDIAEITNMDEERGIVTLVSMTEFLGKIEEAIAKVDVPQRNVELLIYLLEASDETAPSDVPAALSPVVTQLENALKYKSYRLLESILMRVRDGEGIETAGTLPMTEQQRSSAAVAGQYTLNISQVHLSPDKDKPVAGLQFLELELTGPMIPSTKPSQAQINTSIDVPVGQQIVVGKASLDDSGRALIVVLSARVAE